MALSAVTSLLGLLSLVLDDQAALEQFRAAQRAASGSAGALAGRVDAMQLAEGAAADQQENAGGRSYVRGLRCRGVG